MKIIGIGLIVAGFVWGAFAFNMKTTVETESQTIGEGLYSIRVPSQTVHNLDLADRRRIHLIGAGISLLSGILLFGFGSLKPSISVSKQCPFCAESIKWEATICHYCSKDQPPTDDTTVMRDVSIPQKIANSMNQKILFVFLLLFITNEFIFLVDNNHISYSTMETDSIIAYSLGLAILVTSYLLYLKSKMIRSNNGVKPSLLT